MSEPASQSPRAVTSQEIFCAHCVSESTDKTPGDVSSMNGIGRQFYGSTAPCAECASVIRTLWWTIVSIPILPLGSYRYKTAKEGPGAFGPRARFWCRKLPGRHWAQVWKTWAIGLVAAIAVGVGIYIYNSPKS